MEFRGGEDSAEAATRAEAAKTDGEKVYFGCGNETEEPEYNHSQPKNGAVAPKPSDVRNGDLVSLLLAATPPYLYNIPLVPQTFFFSEMLKSFVQAKTERQNMKAQQSHHRRQRKRHWRDVTPPKSMPYEARDKPLELTTPKQPEEKQKRDKSPARKPQQEGGDKKQSELGNFSVEKLANSSVPPEGEPSPPGDRMPPAPPLWYPLLYPPHPPYGIDPLHFFIDLRVSAHFWDRTAKLNNENGSWQGPPDDPPEPPLVGRGRHASAFRVPSPRRDPPADSAKEPPRGRSRNVHYVISSLKDIYKSLERDTCEKSKDEGEGEGEGEGDEEKKWRKGKDLRALIGLELVVDYVKQESDGEEDKAEEEGRTPEGPQKLEVTTEE